jgi:mannose-6-phosphate isomerase-like protein (cupin superfamily)
MRSKSAIKRSRSKIKVVPFDRGQRVDLGKRSFSNLILTRSTVKHNRNMMGYSVFTPGSNTTQKIHVKDEELAYVVSGSGKIMVGTKSYPFQAGDSLYIPPGVLHGVRNDGTEDVVMIFFFSSGDYPKTVDA